ncbi:GGDEF domain-containing protein [Quadrisphaera sp. DSM 44207]|uniref:GGDEF domain-containing protein n=1 Tax=Quadrisphaera sp. DSM 44207 TaxID=1881057 RepID=UPI00115FBFB7|nr:GGDEF domain-containing protein [Quadrisphaera sp. DSM 44207]
MRSGPHRLTSGRHRTADGSEPEGEFRPADAATLGAAFRAAPIALAVVDDEGRCTDVNDAFVALLGYPREELVGRSYAVLTHPDDRHLDSAAVAQMAADGAGPTVEKRFVHQEGRTVWTRTTARLLGDAAPGHAVAVIEHVDQRRDEEGRLRWLALHDPLTGAANRALLDDRMEQALAARDRDGGVLAVVLADVDDFKVLNDRHGHLFGDQVLIAVVRAATAAVRDRDTVARLGGDEFVVLAHVHSAAEAHQVLQRLRTVLRRTVAVGSRRVDVRASCGLAVVDRPGRAAADVLAEADAAMYAAKRSAREED